MNILSHLKPIEIEINMEEQTRYNAKLKPDTTVTIDGETAAKLSRLAKATTTPKRVLISLMLDYFDKYGIDPTKHEAPIKEMEKVTKRLDQFFAFMKKQESDMVRPMVETVATIEQRVSRELDVLRPIFKAVEENDRALKESRKLLADSLNKMMAENRQIRDESTKKLDALVLAVETKLSKKLF